MKYFFFYVDRFHFFVGFFFLFLVSACQNFCSCCSFAKIKHYHWQISSSPSSSHLRIPHSTSSTSSTELQSLGPSSRTASKIIVSHKISVISIVYKFLNVSTKYSKTFVFHMMIHNVWQWNVQITDTVKTKHFKPNSSRTDNVELKQTTARVNLSVFKQNNRGFAFLRWNSSMLTIQTQINMRSIPESLKLFVHLVPFWSRNGPVSSK